MVNETSEIVIGDPFSFQLNIPEKYEMEYSVFVNNVEIAKQNDYYTIENVSTSMVIEVRNLITKTYNITFDTNEKYQIVIDNNVVEYGSNKSFLVELNEAYEKTDDFKVLVNDVEINCANEYYEINNIT